MASNQSGNHEVENSGMEEHQDGNDNNTQLRIVYRELLNEAEQVDHLSIENLNDKLGVLGDLFKNVKTSRELAMDAGLLTQYAILGSRSAKNIKTNVIAFDPVEFAGLAKVVIRSDDDDENLTAPDWLEFGKKAGLMLKRCPGDTVLLGTFPKCEKVKKKREPRAKIGDELKESAPQKVSKMDKSEQDLTTEEVERVLKILRYHCEHHGPAIDFFEFVTDPSSFTKTVENIFHVSFLIKDGFAKLYEDNEGLLTIEALLEKDSTNRTSTSKSNCSVVLSLTKADWRKIVDAYEIERTIIPPRNPTGTKRTLTGSQQ
ncbi:Non-structural maintenance of chromosomes element 4 A [Chamberlinius hualienensis]